QPPSPPVGSFPVIRIDVLPEKGDLAHPGTDEAARLGQDLRYRTRILRTARVGYDAEAAKLVAAFLHRQECGYAVRLRRLWQVIEFGLRRKARVDNARAAGAQRTGDQFGQAMVALGAEHEVDAGRAAHDFGPLRLCHATPDGDYHLAAASGF